ncbi:MAG: inorganic phosphate transporter [Bacteroidales bacterium]|nr:inorganic phosphate transporter [Bacteroidales bacterium]
MFLFFLSSGLFLGWTLGANDAANVFGSAVGSKMVKFRKAAIVASVFVILGAVIQGAGASHTLGKLGSISALGGAFTVALASGLTVFGMTKFRLPISTSQAIVGAIIGWNFFTGNPTDYSSLTKIVTTWISGPILGAIFAIILYISLKKLIRKLQIHLILLDAYIRNALIIVGAFGSYSLGANNIANVVGVFVPSAPNIVLNFGLFTLDGVQLLFLLGGIAIAVGIITYSKRVMMTVGDDIMKLSAEASLVVVLAHSLVLFVFSSSSLSNFFVSIGLPAIPLVPVSSSQAIVGSIMGIGLLKGGRNIKFNVLGNISIGWILTPILAGLSSFISLFFVSNVFKIQVSEGSEKAANQAVEIGLQTLDKANNNSIDLFQPTLYAIILALSAGVAFLLYKQTRYKKEKNIASFNEQEKTYQIQTNLLKKEIESTNLTNKKLENEVNYKKQELMNFALSIIQKNEFLEKLKAKINKLKDKSDLELNHDDLNKLSRLINENLNLDKERENFDLYVSDMNSEFFFRLNKKYPGLTENDKKLCALIRLKLSSKEIASLINISPKSVEVNRYRLRKKMNIQHDERLSDVINKL